MTVSHVLAALIFTASLVAGPALAEIYTWTDASGVQRFTDRLENVPAAEQPVVERLEQTVRLSQRLQFIRQTSAVDGPAVPESSREERIVPFERQGALMQVQVRINDSLVEPFYVDTGASSVVIPERLARALGLDVGATAPRELAMTPGGVTSMKVVELASVDLSGAKVKNLRALVSDRLEYGLLGGAFLRHFNYSVNSESGMIFLEPISSEPAGH